MFSPIELCALAAAVGSGVIAGLCFAFGSFIMPAFDRLGAPAAIRAMQAINAGILRSSAMIIWFGTAVIGVFAAVLLDGRMIAVAAATLYGVGAILITGWGNVPLNEELDRVDPGAPDTEDAWRRYRVRWGRWNSLRTIAMALASAGFALAS